MEYKLFTPGPLCVSKETKEAMLRDVGSRTDEFVEVIRCVRDNLVRLAEDTKPDDYTCVILQGAGTFALEAVLATTSKRENSKVLILENGAYGARQADICEALEIPYKRMSFAVEQPINLERVEEELHSNTGYSLVSAVHSETSTGIINDIETLGAVIKKYSKETDFFVDAMSSFGAYPVSMSQMKIDFLVSSVNKCLESVPGVSYVIANKKSLLNQTAKRLPSSMCFDLIKQYENFERNGTFWCTPATHVLLALKQALSELQQEGGVAARRERYKENNRILREGMKKIGFKMFLEESLCGFIIMTYYYPTHPNFNFDTFVSLMKDKGQILYPGKVLTADTFRIGNIGHLFPKDMLYLLDCIKSVCTIMKIEF